MKTADNLSEQIEILDEFGKKTGRTMPRKEIHLEGMWHESVHIHIINHENQILLQKRSADKSIFPNVWAPAVGGHISKGEDIVETAIREAEEEINIEITTEQLKYLGIVKDSIQFDKFYENEFIHVFTAKKPHPEIDLQLKNAEVSELKWFTSEELAELIETKSSALLPFYLEFWLVLGYMKLNPRGI